MKNSRVLFFAVCFICLSANAQSPYKLAWRADAPILAVGVAFPIANRLFWQPNIPALTPAQVMALQLNTVPNFEQAIALKSSREARIGSDVLLYTSMAAPTLLLLDPAIRKDGIAVGTMYLETLLLNSMLTNATKQLVLRPRPLAYNPNEPIADRTAQDARFSFFSGHTSMSAASSFFAAKVYSDYHPHDPNLPLVWAAAALLPAATATLRMEGGKHFTTDVLVGYLVGAGIGLLVPELHRIKPN